MGRKLNGGDDIPVYSILLIFRILLCTGLRIRYKRGNPKCQQLFQGPEKLGFDFLTFVPFYL